jgi:pimeloyl-ACP methyl ester carboxylesterase
MLVFLGLFQCAPPETATAETSRAKAKSSISVDVNDLGDGTEIKTAGLELMDLPYGLNLLHSGSKGNDSVLVVLVHGYQSAGYEWVMAAKGLTGYFGSSYFYRYNWDDCPDELGIQLADQLKSLQRSKRYDRILVFAHSYGGVVATFAAGHLGRIDAEINVIAAPLSGFPHLMDQCETLVYDKMDKLTYPEWEDQLKLIQHKTVHAQDGAFRDLASDPQDVKLAFEKVIELPPTMDGHRLGHNWSVTWVVDSYLGRPHKH